MVKKKLIILLSVFIIFIMVVGSLSNLAPISSGQSSLSHASTANKTFKSVQHFSPYGTSVNGNSQYVPANQVDPNSEYTSEPAPMGIADYGIGAGNQPYEYNTTSFLGIINITSLQTYNSSLNSGYYGSENGMTFQLNLNMVFYDGSEKYVYWTQNVIDLNTSNNQICFIDNVWNISSYGANMHNSTISGNGTVANSSGECFYYSIANASSPGNLEKLHYPANIELMINTTVADGKPELLFEYNDGSGWQTYDSPVFKFVNNLTSMPEFSVDGYNYEPDGYSFYDAELILGGPGGGTQTQDCLSNLTLALQYFNGHNYQEITNAYNYGSDTAEGICNVTSQADYYNENGSIFESITSGSGYLGQVYNSGEVGIINISTGSMTDGYLEVNKTTRYYFTGSDVNITIAPGTYYLELFGDNKKIESLGNRTVKAGQYLSLSTEKKYSVIFTETGLPSGTTWYVNITDGPDSGAITGTSYSFSLTNGTYSYTIATSDHTYKPSSYHGSFTVNDVAVSQSVAFLKVTYKATFTETGLPSGTTWYVNITGVSSGPISTSSYNLSLTNGTYAYTISTADKTYEPLPSSSSFTVNGTAVTEQVKFTEVLYNITFNETGLPSGTTWTLVFNGISHTLTNTSYVFDMVNGTYSYSATSTNYYNLSGTVTVDGASVPETLHFILHTYNVTFTETGLPSGSIWYVNITGAVPSGPISSSSYNLSLTNGTYSYTIATANIAYHGPSSGKFVVNGINISKPVAFEQKTLPLKNSFYSLSDIILFVIMSLAIIAIVYALKAKIKK
ncbi:MAG: thermopsin [Ferroplasma sp.]